MNLRRLTIPLALGVLGVGVLGALIPAYLHYDPHRSAFSGRRLSQGEILDLTSLLPDETVIVERIFLADVGDCTGTRFVLSTATGTMAKFDCTIQWHRFAEAALAINTLEGVFSVEESDFAGLSAMLKLFRHRPKGFGTASVTYRVEYQRAGKRVGEERFLLPSDFRMRSRDLTPERISEIARYQQIPREAFVGIVTPDMIAERKGEPDARPNAS